ncbi:MAG TPA: protein kinase [Caulobacteraceae bacterium]|nr:protein kinase [Caulobacteraceae bacterium]
MTNLAGRYEVLERIGQGAMADVLRAYDPSINRQLAIKVLKREYREHPQYATRFLREAKAAGNLSHPNIVTIYDVCELDGCPYIVMELLEGETLDAVIQREGRLPVETVMAIGLQLADALNYAHGLGVVHRDIKPSNIILGKDGRAIKIVDFGIARVAQEGGDLHDAETLKTQVGQVLGTPRYMSPEQALGREIDGRSDLFSVGVILYELLTGTKAFPGVSAATLALQITQQDPEPIASLAPEAPRGLQFIIEKLLAKRPDRRFADGGQLAEALRREQVAHKAAADEATAGRRRLPLPARVTLLMATITAIVLMASIGAVLNRQEQALQRMAMTSGSAITSFVAANASLKAADNASLPPEQRDWVPVEAFVKAAAADPNVRSMKVIDADGIIRASTDPARVGQVYFPPEHEKTVHSAPGLTVTETAIGKGAAGFRFVRPILYAGHVFGRVDVSLAKADLDAAAGLSRLLLTALGAATLIGVAAVSFTVARLLALPIRRLKAALDDAARGDLDFRISHNRNDEFGELFDSFNRYTAAMQERLESARAAGAGGPRPVPADPDLERTRIVASPASEAELEAERTVIRAAS